MPVFPNKFHDLLSTFPQHVSRAAMLLVGRLSVGDPAAFRGVKRLQRRNDVYRQRVGASHRLLFRLDPAHLEVVTFIHRADLERTIRGL